MSNEGEWEGDRERERYRERATAAYIVMRDCNGWAAAFIDFPINFVHCPHRIVLDSRFAQRFRGFIDRCYGQALFTLNFFSLFLTPAHFHEQNNLQCYASIVEYLMHMQQKRTRQR